MLKSYWKRSTERIKKFWTQKEFFLKIWENIEHVCEICGKYIYEPWSYTFSHNLWKCRYPEYEYEPRNITIVCSIECHRENDRRNKGKDLYYIHLFSEKSEK